jgi:hypothetical protein
MAEDLLEAEDVAAVDEIAAGERTFSPLTAPQHVRSNTYR